MKGENASDLEQMTAQVVKRRKVESWPNYGRDCSSNKSRYLSLFRSTKFGPQLEQHRCTVLIGIEPTL